MAVRNLKDQHQSQFVKLFEQMTGRYSRWQIWADAEQEKMMPTLFDII